MFDFRYHVVTIVAIFLALAIGILLGVTIVDKVVTGAEQNLKESLQDDLDQTRNDRSDALKQLGFSRQFESQVYPTIVNNLLDGRQVGILSIGELPDLISADVRGALGPSGARLAAIGSIRTPLQLNQLSDQLSKTGYFDIGQNSDTVNLLGKRIGREFVVGGGLIHKLQQPLFSSRSGSLRGVDSVVVYRERRKLKGEDEQNLSKFEDGLIEGLTSQKAQIVGVELSGGKRSQITFYRDHNISSVDDINLVPGQVALVYTLLGAKGQFGVKPSATQLIPETLVTEQSTR